MATKGNTSLNKGIPVIKDAFVVIVKTEWNAHIINKLEAGAKKVLKEQGVSCKTLVVPGAFEIPFAVKNHYAYSPQPPDAYITLGTIIRGDTPHFDYVCAETTRGIGEVSLNHDIPVAFGLLTTDNLQQAMDRAGDNKENKGEEAALTVLEMLELFKNMQAAE